MALKGDEGSASRPGRSLPPGKTQYRLYRMLGGPQGRSGQVRKISPPPGFDPRTVQPVAIPTELPGPHINGGVCIFVHESINFNTTPTHHICKEKYLEICTIKLNLPKIKIFIITICRSSTGNYNYCLRKLESLLNLLYTKKINFSSSGI